MDTILLKNLSFFGCHGVLDEEAVLGQRFEVDVRVELNLKGIRHSDEVKATVSYAEIYTIVQRLAEHQRFKLIEALAESICCEVLNAYPIVQKVGVCVRKPAAPVPAIFDFMGVSIERTREDL